MNHTKPNGERKNIFVSLLIVVLFVGAIVVYANYYKSNLVETPIKEDVANIDEEEPALFNCGLLVKSPIKNQNISSAKGVDVNTILDNTNRPTLGCSWTSFEAQAGVVYIVDTNGKDIAKPTPLGTNEDWMTASPVNYSAHLDIANNYTGKAMVIIKEEDPSGEKVSKEISFSINIIQ